MKSRMQIDATMQGAKPCQHRDPFLQCMNIKIVINKAENSADNCNAENCQKPLNMGDQTNRQTIRGIHWELNI